MNRKHCSAIIFICVTLLNNPFLQVNVWAGAPERPQIAFPRRVNGPHWKIHLMDIDGKNVRQLTKGIAQDSDPSWSPDGKRIAFWSDRGNGGIYVMDADGENVRLLTNQPARARLPAWSPDGKRIAFRARPLGMAGDVYVMDADGNNIRRLTNRPAECDFHPTWSPDGKKIAFAAGGRQRVLFDIYVMDVDGGNVHPLTDNPASDSDPAWSPDGRQIAFKSARAGGGIYVMNANGRNVRRLTFFEEDQHPAWSPDGKKIAFISLRDPIPKVYVMDADGRNQQRLTHDHVPEGPPAWFDPRFALSVASIGSQATIWGWLKRLKQ